MLPTYRSSVFPVKSLLHNAKSDKVGRYISVYLLLKGHKTMLANLVQAILSDPEEAKNEANLELITIVKTITLCTYSNLYDACVKATQDIHQFMSRPKLGEKTVDFAKKLLRGVLFISNHLSAVVYGDIPMAESAEETPETQDQADAGVQSDQQTEICRICENRIPINDFEAHTDCCCQAYLKESQLEDVNEEMNGILREIAENWLHIPWPGEQDSSIVQNTLPAFDISLVLRSALRIDAHGADAPEELEMLEKRLPDAEQLMACNKNATLIEMASCVRQRIIRKRRMSLAIRHMSEVLRFGRGYRPLPWNTTIADFEIIKKISSGAYARVYLAKKKATGDIYAIKVLNKMDVKEKNQVKRILVERDILLKFSNPYIIRFYYSIIGMNNLYLVMEYLPGGDLYSLLQKLGALDESAVKVYTYQIAQALGYLHQKGIIHRDIKPDNILISANGNVKLTDFGLSYLAVYAGRRRSVGTIRSSDTTIANARSCVGTPDYVAPEILMKQEHSFGVDWWALGILVYEMLTGVPPFHADTEAETHERILSGLFEPLSEEEDGVSPEVIDFVNRLLIVRPEQRLGRNGLPEILSHPFLMDLNGKNVKPVFVPELGSRTDTTYFEERFNFTRDESDIQEDIARARKEKTERRSRAKCKSPTPGECSSIAHPPPVPPAPEQEDDDMSSFKSISIGQLKSANISLVTARNHRWTVSSLEQEPETPMTIGCKAKKDEKFLYLSAARTGSQFLFKSLRKDDPATIRLQRQQLCASQGFRPPAMRRYVK